MLKPTLKELEPRDPVLTLLGDHHYVGFSDIEKSRFLSALHFSVSNHRKILRKSGEPYYQHECRSATRLLAAGFGLNLAIPYILHEASEDDGWTKRQIQAIFGEKNARIVDAVSKRPKSRFPSGREARLADHIKRMRKEIPTLWEVAVVKLVDRLDNITCTAGLSSVDQRRLFRETRTAFLPLFYWARQFVPSEHQTVYDLWILEIEFACDNYYRSRRCAPRR